MKHLKYFDNKNSTQRTYNIEDVINYYIECALFTEEDIVDGLEDLTIYDISDSSKEEIRKEIEWFINISGDIINQMTDEQLGHDMWYTRNGHGTGFFDRSYPEHDEKILNKLSEVLGGVNIFNNNGKIEYISSNTYKDWDYELYMDTKKYNL